VKAGRGGPIITAITIAVSVQARPHEARGANRKMGTEVDSVKCNSRSWPKPRGKRCVVVES
jgi:hypothetical protein